MSRSRAFALSQKRIFRVTPTWTRVRSRPVPSVPQISSVSIDATHAAASSSHSDTGFRLPSSFKIPRTSDSASRATSRITRAAWTSARSAIAAWSRETSACTPGSASSREAESDAVLPSDSYPASR